MRNIAVIEPQSIRLESPSPHSMPLVVLWCWGAWWYKNEWSCGGSGIIGSGEGDWVWGQGTRRPPVGCVFVWCVLCVCDVCVVCIPTCLLIHRHGEAVRRETGIGKPGGKSAPTALSRALPGQLLSWFLFDKAFACWLGVYLNGILQILTLPCSDRLGEAGWKRAASPSSLELNMQSRFRPFSIVKAGWELATLQRKQELEALGHGGVEGGWGGNLLASWISWKESPPSTAWLN